MKKLGCLFLAALLLLALGACGKEKSEPELVYVDEGTEEEAPQSVRDVLVLYTAGEAQREAGFYASLEAYREERTYEYLHGYVGLVSLGGALDVLGGETALYTRLDLMNYMDCEAAVPAPEDFAAGADTLVTAANGALFPILCGNLVMAETDTTPMSSWTMASYGGMRVAYVGVVAPEQVDPALLETENIRYELRDCAQGVNDAAAAARTAGADHVVVLGSCGAAFAEALMAECQGVEAFLDGGGRGECYTLTDAQGSSVIYSGLDPALDSIGALAITADGELSAEIVTDYSEQSAAMLSYLASIGYDVQAEGETQSAPEEDTE